MRWLRRLEYWLHFRAHQADLRDELALHQRLRREELERRGYAPGDADAAARRAMGNATYMREEARGVWLPPVLEALAGDWRYGWRGLSRSPAFTTVAVLSLALGVGASTAIFGTIHALLFARLPVPAAVNLVELQRVDRGNVDERFSRAEFDALANGPLPTAMFTSTFATLDHDNLSMRISIDAVDGRYFRLLDLQPARGRLVGPGDDAAPVAVVSDHFWRTSFGSDSAVIGRTMTIDRQPFTIIGITPAGYAGIRFPAIADVTVPYRVATTLQIIHERDARTPLVTVVGRRARGQSLDAIAGELGRTWQRCCAGGALFAAPKAQSATVTRLRVVDISRGIPQPKLDLRGRYGPILFALLAGVGVLLLAGCANVANLLLARSRARSAELAVRIALGASGRRIVSQLVVESTQLALLGGVAGTLLAWWATAAMARARAGDLSGVIPPSPNASVLGFTAAICLASAVACGLVPAISATRTDVMSPIRLGGPRMSRSASNIFDHILVIAQVALALLLVSGASLLVQTLRNLQETTLGFEPAQRLAVTVETRHTSYERQGMTVQLAEEMLRRARAIPGVRSAAFASYVPAHGGRGVSDNVTVPGTPPRGHDDAQTSFVGVTPGYFATLGIHVVEGRDLGPPMPGAAARRREAVVNRSFASKFFPGRDPIGEVFRDADDGDSTATEDRIVGVVGDAKFGDVRATPEPMFFVPIADADWPFLILVARTGVEAHAAGDGMARSLAAAAPGIGVGTPTRLSASVNEALSRERISARLAAMFGIVSLWLVAIGLYGVLLYRITERGREIGVRMALGASGRSVIGLVLGQSMRLVGIGIAAGLPLSVLAGRAVASQLYGVAPYSPVVLSVASALVLATAAAACVVPARRAVSIDPLVALRAE